MPLLQRLSPGPTVPEQMQAEFEAWRRTRARFLAQGTRMQAYFGTANVVLVLARVLLRLQLIEPEIAGQAFRVASRLTQSGLRAWQHGRHRPKAANAQRWGWG